MSVRTDVINLNVNINGDKGKNELNQLRKRAAELSSEMKGLGKNTREYKEKASELQVINDRMAQLRKEIGLTALSQKELTEELKRLQAMKNLLTPQTKEFNELQKQIDAVTDRLKNVKAGEFGFKSFLSSIKDEVKQFGILAAGYLGFDFITAQAKNLIKMQAKLADEQADILKTTSLTLEEVKELDKELRAMDTRTSNSRLRQLAAEAGKLGIDGVENIKKFVAEADKIEVALGEDLGEEGLMKIAKLSGIFKEGMLNVGSGVNAVGQASAASEAYQVDLAFRMAGTAQTAKVSAGDILGYASALEVNGQSSEVAATALNTFFLDFISGANKFGKAAGFAKGELGKMINEQGVNEAFLLWLKRLAESSKGTDDFILKMKKLGIDGARGSNVLLVLSQNIDMVRQQQEIANKAISDGTSIINEYNTKNQNFAAISERVSKMVNSFFTSDSINQFIVSLVSGFESLLGFLPKLLSFVKDNLLSFGLWAAAYAIQVGWIKQMVAWIALQVTGIKGATVAQVLNTLATKADILATSALGMAKAVLTLNMAKARQEYRLMMAAMNVNPWAALLTVIGAIIVAVKLFGESSKKAASEQKILADLSAEAAEKMAETLAVQKISIAILKDEKAGLDSKKKALSDIIGLNPTYLSGLTQANVLTKEGTQLLSSYNNQLMSSFKLQSAFTRVQDEQKKASAYGALRMKVDYAKNSGDGLEYDAIPDELRSSFLQRTNRTPFLSSLAAKVFDFTIDDKDQLEGLGKLLDEEITKANKRVEDALNVNKKLETEDQKAKRSTIEQNIALLQKQLSLYKEGSKEFIDTTKKLADSQAELNKINGVETPVDSSGLTSGVEDPDKKAQRAAQRAAERLEKIRQEISKLQGDIAAMERDRMGSDRSNDELEIQRVKDKYVKLLIEAKKYAAESAQLNQLQKRELDLLFQKQFDERNTKEYDQSLKSLSSYFDKQRQLTDQDYLAGKTNKIQYALDLKNLDIEEANARIQVATDYGTTVKKAAEDIEGFKTDAIKKGITNREAIDDKDWKGRIAKANLAVLTARKNSSDRLEAEKDLIDEQYQQAVETGQYTNEELLTMHAQMLESKKDLDNQYWEGMISLIQTQLQSASDIFSGFMDIVGNREQSELNADKVRNDQKKDNLKKQLDAKQISQREYDRSIAKLDADMDRRQKDYAMKQAKRQKAAGIFGATINTAMGVARAFTDYSWPFNLIVAALVGAAGAIQIAKIASEPLPVGRRGLVVQGPSHEAKGITMVNNQTGRPIAEIEGGEPVVVLSKNTYGNNKAVIDELIYNSNYRNGARVSAGSWFGNMPAQINTGKLLPIMRTGGIANAANIEATAALATQNSMGSQILAINVANADLLKEMVNAQYETIQKLEQQNTNLRAHIVLQDLYDQEALLDQARSLSGINQKKVA